jgi:hypothetical protein
MSAKRSLGARALLRAQMRLKRLGNQKLMAELERAEPTWPSMRWRISPRFSTGSWKWEGQPGRHASCISRLNLIS